MARYVEIAERLRQRIGPEFGVGDRLPSIAALQEEYNVAGLNTIRAALRELAEQRLIRTDPGIGSFVVALPEADGGTTPFANLWAAHRALGDAIAAAEQRAVGPGASEEPAS